MSTSIQIEHNGSSPSSLVEALFSIAIPLKVDVVQKIYLVLGHAALPPVQPELVLAALRNSSRAVKCWIKHDNTRQIIVRTAPTWV